MVLYYSPKGYYFKNELFNVAKKHLFISVEHVKYGYFY